MTAFRWIVKHRVAVAGRNGHEILFYTPWNVAIVGAKRGGISRDALSRHAGTVVRLFVVT